MRTDQHVSHQGRRQQKVPLLSFHDADDAITYDSYRSLATTAQEPYPGQYLLLGRLDLGFPFARCWVRIFQSSGGTSKIAVLKM